MSQCQFRGNKSREGLCLGQMMRWRSAADERRTPAEQGVPDLWTYTDTSLTHLSKADGPGQWKGRKEKGFMKFTWNRNETKAKKESYLITQVPVDPAASGGFAKEGIFLQLLSVIYCVVPVFIIIHLNTNISISKKSFFHSAFRWMKKLSWITNNWYSYRIHKDFASCLMS